MQATPVTREGRGDGVVSVEVQNDFLEKLAATNTPVIGVAELIWNALDADAKRVDVTIKRNVMGGIEAIRVRDDGHGIAHGEALEVFRKLGDSWKKREQRSKGEGRILHGKDGQGRYRVFGVGDEIRWTTTYRDGDQLRSFTISGRRPALRDFEIADPVSAPGTATGTTVEVLNITTTFTSLDDAEDLALRFALYLRKYPKVRITLDGAVVDARQVEDTSLIAAFNKANMASITAIDQKVRCSGVVVDGDGECPVAPVEQHRDVVAVEVCHGDVRPVDPVHVADGHRLRVEAGVVVDGDGEGPIALVEHASGKP